MPGIVNDVSATLVETIHSLLLAGAGRNTWNIPTAELCHFQ